MKGKIDNCKNCGRAGLVKEGYCEHCWRERQETMENVRQALKDGDLTATEVEETFGINPLELQREGYFNKISNKVVWFQTRCPRCGKEVVNAFNCECGNNFESNKQEGEGIGASPAATPMNWPKKPKKVFVRAVFKKTPERRLK